MRHPQSRLALLPIVALACSSKAPPAQHEQPPDEFASHWRQELVSLDPRLSVPVTELATAAGFEPVVISSCSTGSATVQLDWNEPVDPIGVPDYRLDLNVDYLGFQRGFFSAAYPVAVGRRFLLPENSSYLNDEPRMLATGPILFPSIERYTLEASGPGLTRVSLTLSQLGGGKSFDLRFDERKGAAWSEVRRTTFLTPVCPTSF
jgi:hypothetical protein